MKKLFPFLSLMLISFAIFITACEKEEEPIPPAITFKQATGYISANGAAKFGDTLNFEVGVKSNGTDNLVKFLIFFNNQQLLDSTINTQNFTFAFYSTKTILDKEVWKFVSSDIAGNTKTDSIVISGNFGPIYTYNNLKFGAQNNTSEKGFVSYSNSTATQYKQDEAFLHQAEIDMFCFYENTPTSVNLMTLAAPGSNIKNVFAGATDPYLYTTKNVTFFVKTTLTAAQFDAVQNDAVILASFNPKNQFKKAKLLTVGEVYAFKLQSGKYGLYKVTAVEGAETGTLQIAVKIQK
jgi:hypothetical protein